MAITLLPKEFGLGKEAKIARQIMRFSTFFLFFYLVALFIMGIFFFYISRQQRELNSSYNQLSRQIQSLRERESSTILLKDRISILVKLGGKKNFRDALQAVNSLVGEDSGVLIVDIGAAENQVKFTVEAVDTFSLGDFFDKVNKSLKLSSAVIESVTLSPGGSFVTNLSIGLK